MELNFCESGTDHSFQIVIDDNATVSDLITKLQSEVLIPFEHFSLVDSEDNKIPLLTHLLLPLSKFPNTPFQDGALLIYNDLRFDPPSKIELDFIQGQNNLETITHRFSYNRPPVFRHILEKFPKFKSELSGQLSELYPAIDPFPIESREFKALLGRFFIPIDHREVYWKNYLKRFPNDKIALEEIRHIDGQGIIQEQWEYAMEYTPEIYGDVIMLYIPFEINDKKVACFVDSGAQMTLISLDFAKRVGIDHLIDRRFSGKAVGVGSGNIIGSIHSVKIKLGNEFCSFKFQVLDSIGMDVLLGLDNLKRHQMSINLGLNVLEFHEQKIPFLSEGQIKEYKRDALHQKLSWLEENGLNKSTNMSAEETYLESMSTRGKVVGELQPDPSHVELLTFLVNNLGDLTFALEYSNKEAEYDILQQQRLSGDTTRPDAAMVKDFSTPLSKAQIEAQAKNKPKRLTPNTPRTGPGSELSTSQRITQMEAVMGMLRLKMLMPGLTEAQKVELEALIKHAGDEIAALKAGNNNDMTTPTTTTQPGGQGQQQQPQQLMVDAQKLNTLIELGYDREKAMQALAIYGNDIEMALQQLQFDNED